MGIYRKKKKIALIINQIKGGGAEKVAADLSVYFYEKGYDVFLFLEQVPDKISYHYKGTIVKTNMVSHKLKEKRIDKYYYALLRDIIHIKKLKRKYSIDISISFMQFPNLINILSRYRDKVYPTIHSVTSKRDDFNGTIGYNKWIFRFLYQLSDKIIFVSEYCRHDWKLNYGDFLKKTKVIYNPLNVENRDIYKIQQKENNIVCIARFSTVKQHWHIIRSFKLVLSKCPDAKLYLLGEGLLEASLKQMVEELKMNDNVFFTGFVKNVNEYLSKAKIFVQSSHSEACSCSLMEALYMGVPIVTNDCPGGTREIMDAINYPKYKNRNILTKYGFITPQLDGRKYSATAPLTNQEKLFAEAIIELLKNNQLREHLSLNCIEKSEKYIINNIGKVWCTEFEENI